VAAHIVGDEMKSMIEAWFSGDVKTALQWHLKLMPMFKGIFVTTNPVPVKYLLKHVGINAGGVRLPLINATPEEEAFLDDLLQEVKG